MPSATSCAKERKSGREIPASGPGENSRMAHSGSLQISHAKRAGCFWNFSNKGRNTVSRRASLPAAKCSTFAYGGIAEDEEDAPGGSGFFNQRKSIKGKQICRPDCW